MAHFNSTKHRLPDPKDPTSMKNFIKSKYQDKKFYSKTKDKKAKQTRKDSESSEEEEESGNQRMNTVSTTNNKESSNL